MGKDQGAPTTPDGLSSFGSSPQAVSPADAASIPSADEFIREGLTSRIAVMLDDLGQPPLITCIFPKGWRNEDRAGLIALYELCRRTFNKREKDNG